MEAEKIWKERRDYIGTLLYLKHDTVSRAENSASLMQVAEMKEKLADFPSAPLTIGVRQAVRNSIQRRLQSDKLRKNPLMRLMLKIKRALGIKFY